MSLTVLALILALDTSSLHPMPDAPGAVLGTVEVVGARRGPALWKFERGDKTLWVLGTHGPVAQGVAFDDADIRRHVAMSDVVLGPRGLLVGDNVGVLRAMTLWPAIRRTRFNPNGATLPEVLAPDVLARWRAAKARYLGTDADVERLRPMYAAFELHRAALRMHGLSDANEAAEVVRDASNGRRLPQVDARARLSIASPRNAVRAFEVNASDDVACLVSTLDRIDSWLPAARAVGDAWAAGDIAAVPALRSNAPMTYCWATLTNDAIARHEGVEDLGAFMTDAWREALRSALAEHATVFATVPMLDLIDNAGLAAVIAGEGFLLTESPVER